MLMTKYHISGSGLTANTSYSACSSLSQIAVKVFLLALDFEGPPHAHFLPFSRVFVGLYGL